MFQYFILGSGGTSSTAHEITHHLWFYWKEQSSEKLSSDLFQKVCLRKDFYVS